MSTFTDRLEAAATKADEASDIAHQWANGDEKTEVPTASGPLPSLRKFMTDNATDLTQTVAEIAMTAGHVYQSVSDGEAARSDGEYFWVVSSDNDEVLELWLMGASSAADTGKRTYSVISRSEMTDAFLFNESTVSGTLLSSYTKDGIYYGSRADNHSDSPPGMLAGDGVILKTSRVLGNTRWVYQTVHRFANPEDGWIRRVDTEGPASTSWVKISGGESVDTINIKDQAVTKEKIDQQFMYNGVINSGSMNDVDWQEGNYLLTPTNVTDLPDGFTGVSVLEVRKASTWAVHTISSFTNPEKKYWRVTRFSVSDFGTWLPYNSSTALNQFENKTAVFFGDSITDSYGIAERVGPQLSMNIKNFGIGGTRLAQHTTAGYDQLSGFQLATAVNTGDWSSALSGANQLGQNAIDKVTEASNTDWNSVDYIILGYGTNDFGGNNPIGTQADSSGATFWGALNVTIEQILSAYPHIRIMFWSPIWRRKTPTDTGGIAGGSDVSPNTNGDYLYEYVAALLDGCKLKHVEAVDMYYTSGIYETTYIEYLIDQLHPTIEGSRLLADKIRAALQSRF